MKNKQIDPRNKSKPTSDKISSHDALVAISIVFMNNVFFYGSITLRNTLMKRTTLKEPNSRRSLHKLFKSIIKRTRRK